MQSNAQTTLGYEKFDLSRGNERDVETYELMFKALPEETRQFVSSTALNEQPQRSTINDLLLIQTIRSKCHPLWLSSNVHDKRFADISFRIRYACIMYTYLTCPPAKLYANMLFELIRSFSDNDYSSLTFNGIVEIISQHLRPYVTHLAKHACAVSDLNDENSVLTREGMQLIKGTSSVNDTSLDQSSIKLCISQLQTLKHMISSDRIPKIIQCYLFNPCSITSTLVRERNMNLLLPVVAIPEPVVQILRQIVGSPLSTYTLHNSEIHLLLSRGKSSDVYARAMIEEMGNQAIQLEQQFENSYTPEFRKEIIQMPSVSEFKSQIDSLPSDSSELEAIPAKIRRSRPRVKVTPPTPTLNSDLVSKDDIPPPLHIVKIKDKNPMKSGERIELGNVFYDYLSERLNLTDYHIRIAHNVPDQMNHYLRFKTEEVENQRITPNDVYSNDLVIGLTDDYYAQRFLVTFDPLNKFPLFNEIVDPIINRLEIPRK